MVSRLVEPRVRRPTCVILDMPRRRAGTSTYKGNADPLLFERVNRVHPGLDLRLLKTAGRSVSGLFF
jgi:hypothetical protein